VTCPRLARMWNVLGSLFAKLAKARYLRCQYPGAYGLVVDNPPTGGIIQLGAKLMSLSVGNNENELESAAEHRPVPSHWHLSSDEECS